MYNAWTRVKGVKEEMHSISYKDSSKILNYHLKGLPVKTVLSDIPFHFLFPYFWNNKLHCLLQFILCRPHGEMFIILSCISVGKNTSRSYTSFFGIVCKNHYPMYRMTGSTNLNFLARNLSVWCGCKWKAKSQSPLSNTHTEKRKRLYWIIKGLFLLRKVMIYQKW